MMSTAESGRAGASRGRSEDAAVRGDALTITKWRSLHATRGTSSTLTWEGLAEFLSKPAPRPPDLEPKLAGWSPATFDEDKRLKGRVREMAALGLDLDKGGLELDALREAFEGVRALVHNTRRSQPGAQRWRVVVAISRAMTPAEHAVVWARERDRLALLGIVLDEQTKDPSRFWFVPCAPASGDFIFDSLEGAPLDVDAILAEVPPLLESRPSPERTSTSNAPEPAPPSTARTSEPGWLASITMSTRKRRAAAYVQQAEAAVMGERGSNVAMRVATAVVRGFALDSAAALEVLAPWNTRCVPPWSAAELAHKVDEAARVGAMGWGAKLEEKQKAAVLVALPSGDTDRPVIRISVDLARVVDAGIQALTRDASIYQRDGQLVHVVRVPESEADAATLEGTPQIRGVAMATLRERLAGVAQWLKLDGRTEMWKPSAPADTVVGAVATRGMWKGMRPIVGVIEAPSLRPDGTVIQSAGYDAATGFVLVPSDDFAHVPESPTLDDAARALAMLSEPLADFPYANEAHRAATLAAVLTLVARPAIVGSVPGFIFDASTRGSGKTLQADVVAIIATGRVSAKMGYPIDDEELEKVLGAYALRGALLVNFDNVSRPFGGGPLDRCLTATDSVELRVLGRSEVPALRWRAMVMATGNNVELIGDTARRVIFSSLEPNEESPEDRTDFRIADLRAWVRARRPQLVVAALTILRAYVVAGRPNVGTKSWGSFETWSALVPPALVWAGAADAMNARPTSDGALEPEKAALQSLLRSWERLAGEGGITAKGALQVLYPSGREPEHAHGPPDGFDDLREAIEVLTGAQHGKPPTPSKLGLALRRSKRRLVGGLRLEGAADRNGVIRWVVCAPEIATRVAPRSPASPALAESPSVSSAGDAGDEGHVSSHAREDHRSDPDRSWGAAGENAPASPASPAPGIAEGSYTPTSTEAPGNTNPRDDDSRDDEDEGFFDGFLKGGPE